METAEVFGDTVAGRHRLSPVARNAVAGTTAGRPADFSGIPLPAGAPTGRRGFTPSEVGTLREALQSLLATTVVWANPDSCQLTLSLHLPLGTVIRVLGHAWRPVFGALVVVWVPRFSEQAARVHLGPLPVGGNPDLVFRARPAPGRSLPLASPGSRSRKGEEKKE